MKGKNGLKLVGIVIALVVVVALLFLGLKAISNKKGKEITGDAKEKVETVAVEYIANLTTGTGTIYNGTDVLFSKAEAQTYKDLDKVYVLNAAYSYAINNGKASVDSALYDYVKRTYHYTDCDIVSGEEIRNGVKALFGEDFKDTNAELYGFTYKFIYDENNDIYIILSETVGVSNPNYSVYTKVVSAVEKDKKVEVDLVVAYVYKADNTYSFTKDVNLKEAVFTSAKYEMDDAKVDSFDHYIITLNKDGDNYTFESIQKK